MDEVDSRTIIGDPLLKYSGELEYASVAKERARRLAFLDRSHWDSFHELMKTLPTRTQLERRGVRVETDFSVPAVTVSCDGDLTREEQEGFSAAARRLMPWRKGPFSLFGLEINAEWRSDLKWERLIPHIALKGQRVADVGCGNGYYMFRALHEAPALVVGFDPAELFYQTFRLVQHVVGDPRLQFEMLGVEHLSWFPEFFDTIVCMGVLYHQRDPLRMLRQLFDGLRPGGTVVVETLGIDCSENDALSPDGRYGKMKNVFYLPTPKRLETWMQQVGFCDMSVIATARTTSTEQRRTDWMVFESLADFLDPDDDRKTVEGHPAPWRFMMKAQKPV